MNKYLYVNLNIGWLYFRFIVSCPDNSFTKKKKFFDAQHLHRLKPVERLLSVIIRIIIEMCALEHLAIEKFPLSYSIVRNANTTYFRFLCCVCNRSRNAMNGRKKNKRIAATKKEKKKIMPMLTKGSLSKNNDCVSFFLSLSSLWTMLSYVDEWIM